MAIQSMQPNRKSSQGEWQCKRLCTQSRSKLIQPNEIQGVSEKHIGHWTSKLGYTTEMPTVS